MLEGAGWDGCDVLHAATNAHASAPLSRPTNLEIMCVPLILDDEDGIGGSLQRPFNSLHFADAGLLTGRTGNPSLSEVESGFPTITEPPFDHDHCSHDYVLGRTTIHLVRIGPRQGTGRSGSTGAGRGCDRSIQSQWRLGTPGRLRAQRSKSCEPTALGPVGLRVVPDVGNLAAAEELVRSVAELIPQYHDLSRPWTSRNDRPEPPVTGASAGLALLL